MVIQSRQLPAADAISPPENLENLREERRIVSGIHEIYGSLYDAIGFGALMNGCPASSGIMKDIVIGIPEKYQNGRRGKDLHKPGKD